MLGIRRLLAQMFGYELRPIWQKGWKISVPDNEVGELEYTEAVAGAVLNYISKSYL